MSERTGIGWTEATWNPWHGCHKVSPGCKNCYMFREKRQYGQDPDVVVRSKTKFYDPLKWKEPRLVFTCSWSDWFIEEADAWRDEAWDIIRRTPHTYQILTKRIERAADHLPPGWPLPNVWLGVSVENQRYADERIPRLLDIPAAVRFVSYEPALGPVDFQRFLTISDSDNPATGSEHSRTDGEDTPEAPIPTGPASAKAVAKNEGAIRQAAEREVVRNLDWGIVGGESGFRRREMEISWLERTVRDFRDAGVPIYVKQDSGPKPGMQGRIPDALWIHEFPEVRE